ncbi:hypothetical protein EJB05_06789, partial [Eragrostis curvula]
MLTTVSVPHLAPPPFKPLLPHLSLFLASISGHHSPLRSAAAAPRGKKDIPDSHFEFPIRPTTAAAPDRMRGAAAASPSAFWCGFRGLASARSLSVGRRTAAVASGSVSSPFSARGSFRLAAGSRGLWVFDFVGLDSGFVGSRSCPCVKRQLFKTVIKMQVPSDVELDSAVFQVSSALNRYEAIACSKGNTELIASGPFDLLILHLEDAKKFQSRSSSGTFKLLLTGDGKGSSWFTKPTLQRFLHIVNSSDTSKSVNGVLDEMSQLEETRKFHQSLYFKEQQTFANGAVTGGLFGTGAIAQQGNVGPNSSEGTKNELLRALDLRLTALKEEIWVLLNKAVGSKLSTREISDLSAFVQHFGPSEFSWLMRCMLLILDYQPPELPLQQASADNVNEGDNAPKTHDISPQTNIERTISNKVSPAKLAQVERESSTESDDSSESSDEGEAVVERSRALVRSASPRRSASPMRRVQIGRSGSRRSTAIAIKSLSYFPPSQRIPLDKDDESSTCNGGETDQPPRKSDNNVRRMSVQDAISLFESKQKDQNPDSQKQKAGLFATKSVLRRWSAGMGDSLNSKSEEKISDSTSENKSNNMASDSEKNQVEIKAELDRLPNSVATTEVEGLTSHADCHDMKGSEMESEMPSDTYGEHTMSGQEENSGRALSSAEWNRQKEAELNQMLMKMMEVMPGKFAGTNVTAAGLKSTNQKKGGSHGQHREKPETKIRTEKGVRRPAKEANTKLPKETVGLNKSSMTPKTGTITEKRISPAPQRARRNSSPPVLPKEVVSKTPARKSSPKPSPAPATRGSWSGGSLTKSTTSTAQKSKSPPGMASTSTPTSRRRTPAPASSQPTSKVERTLQPTKNRKETATATKPTIKGQEEKKTKTATRTSRIAKISPASEEKSSATTKQTLHNKVSKKSSVVPLESKPVKKTTGICQTVGSGAVKSKVPKHDSSKDSESVNQAEDKEQTSVTTEPTNKVLEADLAQPAHDVDEHLEISLNNDDLNIEKTEKPASSLTATEMGSCDQIEPSTPSPAPPPDEDMDISSAAWVEVEHQEQDVTDVSENVVAEDVTSPGMAPLPSSSPRIRHSLSQMLQADSNEPEIIEWGNAENPPAIVFHKDSPKGFKRLLKFARKNKGDNNTNGWASPSVVSEGEDEFDESRVTSDGGNSSRRTFDGSKTNSILSAPSTTGSFNSMNSDKLRERPGATTSTKASRSFFSLSTFRSSKSNESKLR